MTGRRVYSDFFPKLFFWTALAFLLFLHLRVFLNFNLVYTDSDQPLLWGMAGDYSKGQFYEPRFYGQAYSTGMEGLFAVPFLWLGVPVYYAVPLATHLVYLFPIFFVAFFLYFKKRFWNAALVFAISLSFPNTHDFLVSLPRGFVTGIFFTGFYVVALVSPANTRYIFGTTVIGILAYFVNPGSLIISVPVFFYLWLFNCRNRRYYIATLCGGASYILFYFLFDYFYVVHPEYVMHQVSLESSMSLFFESLAHLDIRFAHVSPFIQGSCAPLLVFLLIVGVVTWRWDKKIFAAFLLFCLVLVASFSNFRTADGSDWIFFPQSRMYLGVPMSLTLLLSIRQVTVNGISRWLFFVPILFAGWKASTLHQALEQNVKANVWQQIVSLDLQETIENLANFKRISELNRVQKIYVEGNFWLKFPLTYGAQAVFSDFPSTELIGEDRRYWVRNGDQKTVTETFLLISTHRGLDKLKKDSDPFLLTSLDGGDIYIVKNNRLTKTQFLKRLKELEEKDTKDPLK